MIGGMTTNAQRAHVSVAGDYMIFGGAILAVLAAAGTVLMLFTGGDAATLTIGILPGLALMGVGYLKKISATLTAQAFPGE